MESAIISTASSLDEVLEKLNKDEKERKIGRKEMENIFDNIVNNGEGESDKCFYELWIAKIISLSYSFKKLWYGTNSF